MTPLFDITCLFDLPHKYFKGWWETLSYQKESTKLLLPNISNPGQLEGLITYGKLSEQNIMRLAESL